jgi:hypothetical protein
MSLYPFVLLALATLVSRFAALSIAAQDEDGAGDLPMGEVTEE